MNTTIIGIAIIYNQTFKMNIFFFLLSPNKYFLNYFVQFSINMVILNKITIFCIKNVKNFHY